MRSALPFLTISEAAGLIRAKQLSPLELVQATLARLEAVEPQVHAYVRVTPERALATARRAVAEIGKGHCRGPLHGIPYSVKENYFVRGLPATNGSRIFASYVPGHDAAVVERLEAAGAVLIGKTNMHEFAYGGTTQNPFFGGTRNPWDLRRIPGGSSGGAGAALASGTCLLALGTDSGGSVRIPAAFNGVSGLAPTLGQVSHHGIWPLSPSLVRAGPLVRSAEDAALVLSVIAGQDHGGPPSSHAPGSPYVTALTQDLRGLRIGLARDFFAPIDPEVRVAVEAAVRTLEGLGAGVTEVSLPLARESVPALMVIILAEAYNVYREHLAQRMDEVSDEVRLLFEMGALISAQDYLDAMRLRRLVQEEFARAFRDVQVLASPTTAAPAPLIGQETLIIEGEELTRDALARMTAPFNMAGVPALSIPCGFTASGLPVGLHLAAPWFDEGALLRAAHAYQQVTDWHRRVPPGSEGGAT